MKIKAIFSDILSLEWPQYLIWGYTAGIIFTHIFLQSAAIIYFLLLLPLIFQRKNALLTSIHLWLILFIISGVIAFGAVDFSGKYVQRLLPHLVLLGLVPLQIWHEKFTYPELENWAKWLILGACLASFAGVYNHFNGMPRTEGFFGSYFTIAVLLSATIPITCGFLLKTETPKEILLLTAASVLQLIVLWWSYTRSAFLGFFIGIGCWGFWLAYQTLRKQYQWSRIRFIKWSIIASLPLILVILMLTAKDARINPFYKPDKDASSREQELYQHHSQNFSSDRKQIILDAIDTTQVHLQNGPYMPLIIGHGLESRSRMIDSYITSWESDYLQIFMNQGILGLIMLLAIYWLFFREIIFNLISPDSLRQGFAIGSIAFSVMSFFTLQLATFNSAGIFVLLYAFLSQSSQKMRTY